MFVIYQPVFEFSDAIFEFNEVSLNTPARNDYRVFCSKRSIYPDRRAQKGIQIVANLVDVGRVFRVVNHFQPFLSRNDVNAVRFVMPDMAIEDGTTAVIPSDGAPPSQARYTDLHIEKNGQWVLQSVREAPYAPPGSWICSRSL
jgi:hypothetical protein